MCVQVCPTGIDIRDGLQMDCIGCAACIDACDDVMDKMGYARGLVSYTSETALAGEATRILRPRLIAYATAIVIMLGALWFALDARELVDMSVVKDRTVLYRKNSDGDIVNVYRLKITNKTQTPAHYELQIANDGRLSLTRHYTLDLIPGEILDMPISVVMKGKSAESGMTHFDFVLVDSTNSLTREAANFIYPAF